MQAAGCRAADLWIYLSAGWEANLSLFGEELKWIPLPHLQAGHSDQESPGSSGQHSQVWASMTGEGAVGVGSRDGRSRGGRGEDHRQTMFGSVWWRWPHRDRCVSTEAQHAPAPGPESRPSGPHPSLSPALCPGCRSPGWEHSFLRNGGQETRAPAADRSARR